MYLLKTEESFDSAHFLSGYNGKCRNLHGHQWRVIVEIHGKTLSNERQTRDMLVDFGDLKHDLKQETDFFDHALIIEKGSLRPTTLTALQEENFKIIELPFRPTAERFAAYFYSKMKSYGYALQRVTVYETPKNCAIYEE